MRYNKMIDRAQREKCFASSYDALQIDETRRTGKSTGIALLLIGAAMTNPGQRITIIENQNDTVAMRKYLANMMDGIILDLKLNFFVINLNDLTIVYNVYTTNPWEIK